MKTWLTTFHLWKPRDWATLSVVFMLYAFAWSVPINKGQVYVTTPQWEANYASMNPLQWGLFQITPPVGRVALLQGVGGRSFSTICDATCGTATAICKSGSAIDYLRTRQVCSVTTPCSVLLGATVFNECISIDAVTDVAIIGSGINATIIRPNTQASGGVDGGTIRIANATTVASGGAQHTTRIEIAFLTAENHVWSSPEAALQIGNEGGDTGGSRTGSVYVHDARFVGIHDGVQLGLSRLSTDVNLSHVLLKDVVVISAHDVLTKKGWAVLDGQNLRLIQKSNYCETTNATVLAALTGTSPAQTLAGAATITLSAGTASLPVDSLSGREITLSACVEVNNNGKYWITRFDPITQIATVDATTPPGFVDAATNCTYNIAAMPSGSSQNECTVFDWSASHPSGSSSPFWKNTCYHQSLTAASGPPSGDMTRLADTSCSMEVNDFGSAGAFGDLQNEMAGAFMYSATVANSRHGTVILDNFNIDMRINADMQSPASGTTTAVACIAAAGSALESGVSWTGNCRIVNTGDPDIIIAGVYSGSTGAGSVAVPSAAIDITNSGGGVGATATAFVQANTSTLSIFDSVSSSLLKTSGTIIGWPETCFTIPNAIATDDDVYISSISDSNVGLQIQYAACRCSGTCAGTEQLALEDEAGNAISGTINCVDNGAALSWTDVRADADATLPAGTSPRIDTITAGAATDDLSMCVRATSTRWRP